MKLKELIENFNANGFVLEESWNGSSERRGGTFKRIDDEYGVDILTKHGDAEMRELEFDHTSYDGFVCTHASDWITKGEGDNSYRVRLFFTFDLINEWTLR